MIDAKTLRIGNIVSLANEQHVIEREDFAILDFKQLEQIPLTHELAMKFNVEWKPLTVSAHSYYFDFNTYRIYTSTLRREGESDVALHASHSNGGWCPLLQPIETVDEFQNILFFIGKIEVTLKPETANV